MRQQAGQRAGAALSHPGRQQCVWLSVRMHLIRPETMLDLARRAGYADGQILPIEHPAWRFYRLVP